MGIPGLQGYISRNCPEAKQTVSIKKLVEEYRRRNPNVTKPEIVCSWVLAFEIYGTVFGKLDNICGGQYLEFYHRIKSFVESFNELGIKLVFCFHEGYLEAKRSSWAKKSANKIHDIKEVFEKLNQNYMNYLRCSFTDVYQNIFRVFFKQIIVDFSITHDVLVQRSLCDESNRAIAKYAKDNNCIAILTEDSDFIIYDTVPYLSVRQLDIEKMETIMYNREMICNYLGLSMRELPIFASLYGNDVMAGTMLKQFHEYLLSSSVRSYSRIASRHSQKSQLIPSLVGMLVPAICKFISSYRQLDLWESVVSVITKLYNDESVTSSLQASRNNYNLDMLISMSEIKSIDDNLLELPETYLEMCNYFQLLSNRFIYHVLADKMPAGRVILEDFNSDACIPSQDLYQPIRQHLYGIVIKNGFVETPSACVNENWIEPNGELKTDVAVPYVLININGRVATLKDLWCFKDDNEHQNYKLEVFLRCLDISLPKEALLDISPCHVPLVVVVNYLAMHPEVNFKLWEITALLVQAVHPKGQDRSWLQDLSFGHCESRAVHLAAVFTEGLLTVRDVLFVCCSPFKSGDFLLHKCFDGKRFQYCYQEMKKLQQQDCDPMDEAIIKSNTNLLDNNEIAANVFHHLKDIAMEGVDFSQEESFVL